MTSTDQLLNEFIDAWNEGRRPQGHDYIERARENERDELAGLIGAFLELTPTPEYSQEQLDELSRDPLVQRVAALVGDESELVPSPIRRLRDRAKLKREDVVARLAAALGVTKAEPKVAFYYHQLENDMLDPQHVSQRVFKALAAIFGTSERELEFREWSAAALGSASAEPLYTRAEPEVETDFVMHDRLAPPPASPGEEWDEVDELFRGGR